MIYLILLDMITYSSIDICEGFSYIIITIFYSFTVLNYFILNYC